MAVYPLEDGMAAKASTVSRPSRDERREPYEQVRHAGADLCSERGNAARYLLSTLIAPGPKLDTYNRPPMMARFFKKFIISICLLQSM